MSSIVTEELFNIDDVSDEITDVVRNVEEKTFLQQRRLMAFRVKLQELKDRRKKLDAQRINRLADHGINVNLKAIKDEVRKLMDIEKERRVREMDDEKCQLNAQDIEISGIEVNIPSKSSVGVSKNPNDDNRLGNVIEKLQNNKKQEDKENKGQNVTRRQSIRTVVSTKGRAKKPLNKSDIERRSSLSTRETRSGQLNSGRGGSSQGKQQKTSYVDRRYSLKSNGSSSKTAVQRRSSFASSGTHRNSARQSLVTSDEPLAEGRGESYGFQSGSGYDVNIGMHNPVNSLDANVMEFLGRPDSLNLNETMGNVAFQGASSMSMVRRNSLRTGDIPVPSMPVVRRSSLVSGNIPASNMPMMRRNSLVSRDSPTSSMPMMRRNSLVSGNIPASNMPIMRRNSLVSRKSPTSSMPTMRRNSLVSGNIPASNMPVVRRNSLVSGNNTLGVNFERSNSWGTTNRDSVLKSPRVTRRGSIGGSFQSEKSAMFKTLTALESNEFRRSSRTIANALRLV